jgi:hypothetical protein
MKNLAEFVDRYVAVWNQPDPERRRVMIRELWSDQATHLLQPPVDIKASAAAVGMVSLLEIRGHKALEQRVTTAYEKFVAPGTFTFRPRANPERIRDLVKLHWEMVRNADGEVAAVGLELLFLDGRDWILTDYQFIEQ